MACEPNMRPMRMETGRANRAYGDWVIRPKNERHREQYGSVHQGTGSRPEELSTDQLNLYADRSGQDALEQAPGLHAHVGAEGAFEGGAKHGVAGKQTGGDELGVERPLYADVECEFPEQPP